MSIYDDPALKQGAFVTWNEPGDEIAGDVVDVRKGTDFNGGPCPELVIRTDDGEDHVLTAGQAHLKALIMHPDSGRPVTGDRVQVKFVRTEKADKGMKKVFELNIKRGGAKGTEAAGGGTSYGDEEPF
jgi:hypothetical protein